jgi:hypothetical protein
LTWRRSAVQKNPFAQASVQKRSRKERCHRGRDSGIPPRPIHKIQLLNKSTLIYNQTSNIHSTCMLCSRRLARSRIQAFRVRLERFEVARQPVRARKACDAGSNKPFSRKGLSQKELHCASLRIASHGSCPSSAQGNSFSLKLLFERSLWKSRREHYFIEGVPKRSKGQDYRFLNL